MKLRRVQAVGIYVINLLIRAAQTLLLITVLISCKRGTDDPGESIQADIYIINAGTQFQTIRNFGASDAWSCQFVGNWPDSKKEQIASMLYSKEIDESGQPKGIGLSAWRFNIGAGSAEQGEGSDIGDEWRRASGYFNGAGSYDWTKQPGQQWFLEQAAGYDVETLIAFVNSPPVQLTRNGKAYSAGGSSTNLQAEHFETYGQFLAGFLGLSK